MIFGYIYDDGLTIGHEYLEKELEDTGCHEIVVESSEAEERPALADLLSCMRSNDTLIVWDIKHLGSQLNLARVATILGQKRAHLKSIKEGIDTKKESVLR